MRLPRWLKLTPYLMVLEKCFFGREYMQDKYCKLEHKIGYVPGHTASNGHYQCANCGLTDLEGLKVNYEKYPWYEFH
jgi:hypothetical protein